MAIAQRTEYLGTASMEDLAVFDDPPLAQLDHYRPPEAEPLGR